MASTLVESAQIRIHRSPTLNDAKARLHATKSRVLLTDVSFQRGGWEDALRMAARRPVRTALVLVSRLADERLWIDALERGAYDLILQPFHADELRRILGNAHLHATGGAYLAAPQRGCSRQESAPRLAVALRRTASTG